MKSRKLTSFKKDGRRKHHHWHATVFYKDGERFARTYVDHKKADTFATFQKKSPVVKMARVTVGFLRTNRCDCLRRLLGMWPFAFWPGRLRRTRTTVRGRLSGKALWLTPC